MAFSAGSAKGVPVDRVGARVGVRVACWLLRVGWIADPYIHRLDNVTSSKQATPGRTQAHLFGGRFSHGGMRSMRQRCKPDRPAFLRSIVGIRHPLYAGLSMTEEGEGGRPAEEGEGGRPAEDRRR